MISVKPARSESQHLKNLISDSAIVLAILTAALYCIGTAHFYGLLNTLNTDPYLIDRNFHQIIYYGALTLFNAISRPLIYILTFLMTLYIAVAIGILEYNWTYRRKKRLVRLRAKIRKLNFPKNSMLRFSISACTTIIVIIFILIYFQLLGREDALDFINDIKDKNTKDPQKITIKVDSSEIELFRVACGSNFCLGLEEAKMQIRIFDKNTALYTKIITE